MTDIQLTSEITVEEIQQVGSDEMIVRAMLASTGKDRIDLDEAGIQGRIKFLMTSRHGAPFEHGSLTVRVHAPAKVWWEWVRHRIGWSYSLESSRYKNLSPVFYIPPRERPLIRPEGFKSSNPLFVTSGGEYESIVAILESGYQYAWSQYRKLLEYSVDRGLAMLVLGQGVYFTGYATANPRSILAFLELRTDHPEAKRPSKPLYEIRVAADQLEAIFARHWPLTHRAWVEHGRMAP